MFSQKFKTRRFHRVIYTLAIGLFTLILMGTIPPTFAQQNLTPDINSTISIIRVGNTISAPVIIDGYELFRVAMDLPVDPGQKTDNFSIQRRAKVIQNELYAILDNQLYGGYFAQGFDPQNLMVTVKKLRGNPVIFVGDNNKLQERAILTVTPSDAQYNGYSVEVWADQLAEIIKQSLLRGYQQRQPEYLYRMTLLTLGYLLGAVLLTFMIYLLQKKLWKEWLILEPRYSQESAENRDSIDLEHPENLPETTDAQKQQKQKTINEYTRLFLKVIQVSIWVFLIWRVTQFFPYTRLFSVWLSRDPFLLLIIAVGSYVAIRISALIINSFLTSLQNNYDHLSSGTSHRRQLRFSTLSMVLKGLSKAVWIIITIILVLEVLAIPIAPLVAGLGIIGLALSFGSQNLIRDVLNGIFILLEDQYAVGDHITIGETSGNVENMNLRMTQIRGKEGRLTTIPNGTITTVHNHTKDWARVDFKVTISYQSDLTLAINTMKKVIEEMSQESDWKNSILTPIVSIGVNELTTTGVELGMSIQTAPNSQWSVGREFRFRLKQAFDSEGIEFGS